MLKGMEDWHTTKIEVFDQFFIPAEAVFWLFEVEGCLSYSPLFNIDYVVIVNNPLTVISFFLFVAIAYH